MFERKLYSYKRSCARALNKWKTDRASRAETKPCFCFYYFGLVSNWLNDCRRRWKQTIATICAVHASFDSAIYSAVVFINLVLRARNIWANFLYSPINACEKKILNLPFGIGEYEFPKFEITQNDALLVATFHHFTHLTEQPTCFWFAQTLSYANVGMKVTLYIAEAGARKGLENLFRLRLVKMGKWCHTLLRNLPVLA